MLTVSYGCAFHGEIILALAPPASQREIINLSSYIIFNKKLRYLIFTNKYIYIVIE